MEKNKLMMIIIIVLLVILLVSVGVVSFFAYRVLSASGQGEEDTALGVSATLSLDQIWKYDMSEKTTANLAVGEDGSNKHFISIGVTVGLNASDPKNEAYIKLQEQLQENEKVMSSVIIDILRNKTFEEVSNPNSKEILQDEILAKLQEAFNTNMIVAVYFYQFLTT